MRPKQLDQIGVLLALIVPSACSKKNGQPAGGADSSDRAAAANTIPAAHPAMSTTISLRNIYSIQVAGGQGAYLITELENTGKAGIIAFQGKWTIKDDLDATIADQEVRFTGDTP